MAPRNPYIPPGSSTVVARPPTLVTVTLLVTVEQLGPVACSHDEIGNAVARYMRRNRVVWAGADKRQTGYRVSNVNARDVTPLAAASPR
jgi:hypothetical protein